MENRNGKGAPVQIPDDLPEDLVNHHLENIKKRRSSIRRSTNGGNGLHSTLRVACSVLNSAPPDEKKKRITELCLSHALQTLKTSANDEEYDVVYEFEEELKGGLGNILKKVSACQTDTVRKQESQTRRNIDRLTEEKIAWQCEFQQRRQKFLDTVKEFKDAKQGKLIVGDSQRSKLKQKDSKYLNEIPNFNEWINQIPVYNATLRLGLVQMEKLSSQIRRELSNEKKLDFVHEKLETKPFDLASC